MTLVERPPSVMRQRRAGSRYTANSLVASAALLTGDQAVKTKLTTDAWMSEAWAFYDAVGELRSTVNWIANATSKVNLMAARTPARTGDEPTPIVDPPEGETLPAVQERARELVEAIASGPAGQGQMLSQIAKHITVAGVSYVRAIGDPLTDQYVRWEVYSNEEVRKQNGGDGIEVENPETGAWELVDPDLDLMFKVWRSHPRRRAIADSPVRAISIPLRAIVQLGKRTISETNSRLAGNGVWLVPTEAEFPAGQGQPEVGPNGEDLTAQDGVDNLVRNFLAVSGLAYEDPESPAARSPLIVKMPGEFLQYARHQTFASDLSSNIDAALAAQIRRVALGTDLPPEKLLGVGGMNHWGAWQVTEEAISTVIAPLAELVVNPLTTKYLRNALREEGFSVEECDTVLVWYDVQELEQRPDRTGAAETAHDKGVITNRYYAKEAGLDEEGLLDPKDPEYRQRQLERAAAGAPTLAPGAYWLLGIITDAERDAWLATLNGGAPPVAGGEPPASGESSEDRALPDTQDAPPSNEAALLAAADVVVVRALEVAGNRLRSAAARGVAGGAARVPCDDPTLLHTQIDATSHASLDKLLEGAWDRVGPIAARYGYPAAALTASLDAYVRGLLGTGHAHDFDRLTMAVCGGRHLAPH